MPERTLASLEPEASAGLRPVVPTWGTSGAGTSPTFDTELVTWDTETVTWDSDG